MKEKQVKRKPKKLARVIRFVELGVLPAGIAAQYDPVQNLVRIDKPLYDTLNTFEQSQLLFAKEDQYFEYKPLS